MESSKISKILAAFDGVEQVETNGNTFFFHGPDRRMPFATLVTSDAYDTASNLNRPGVFRLNIGASSKAFQSMFESRAAVAGASQDYTALDTIMPHPVYGGMNWICVLNPSEKTFEKIHPLMIEAAERSAGRTA